MASFDDKPVVFFADADSWDAFLAASPPSNGVRLRQRKKSSAAPGLTYEEALLVALCHGWIDGMMRSEDADYVQQSFTPRRRRSPWSATNKARVATLIETGRMRPAGQAEIDRAKADGRWDAD
ncbi:YdeI family protein [Nocardioides sp. R-C-SC26]|uniref:YdeI/OmpD-associated family protein n=1 Tax=Nocardioides sp. R-C-SC26 TaxID=2870414 RepID=UPI001E34EFE4|nr:hypothetical protein [Nocardioides sp. R-C-SC26]